MTIPEIRSDRFIVLLAGNAWPGPFTVEVQEKTTKKSIAVIRGILHAPEGAEQWNPNEGQITITEAMCDADYGFDESTMYEFVRAVVRHRLGMGSFTA
jgi:hypothetical protein